MVLSSMLTVMLLLAGEGELPWYQGDRWRTLNLVLFLAFLIYVLIKKVRIGQVFDNRAAAILKELEQAKKEKEEAQQRLEQLQERFGRLDEEIAEIRAGAERESAREQERIAAAAQSDAEKIAVAARREIEGAMKAARTELRAFVAEQSVHLAETIVRQEMRPDDNSKMVHRFIDGIGEVKPEVKA